MKYIKIHLVIVTLCSSELRETVRQLLGIRQERTVNFTDSLTGWDENCTSVQYVSHSLPTEAALHAGVIISYQVATDSASTEREKHFWRSPIINMKGHHSFTYIPPPGITC